MINFRYHLVSLTAVFLALAVGILLGASVVNGGLVDGLRGQLGSVKDDVGRVDQQNQLLRKELDSWTEFSTKAGPGLLAGRLQGVPVLLLGVRGINADRLDELRSDLVSADARVQGTVWLTSKMQLDRQENVRALSDAFDLGTTDAEVVRRAVLARLATELVQGSAAPSPPTTTLSVPNGGITTLPGVTTTLPVAAPRGGVLAALAAGSFVDIDSPDAGRFDASLPLPAGTRFVVASGDGADVPDTLGAIPLVRALADTLGTSTRVVAVEPGRPAQGRDAEVRAHFIGPLRAEGKELDAHVSTVNNVEDFKGRVAAVLALVDLGVGRVGHYGVGSGADRLVPESG
jgi:hypothetical protein